MRKCEQGAKAGRVDQRGEEQAEGDMAGNGRADGEICTRADLREQNAPLAALGEKVNIRN